MVLVRTRFGIEPEDQASVRGMGQTHLSARRQLLWVISFETDEINFHQGASAKRRHANRRTARQWSILGKVTDVDAVESREIPFELLEIDSDEYGFSQRVASMIQNAVNVLETHLALRLDALP
jgi:hypothetical protein